MEWWSSRNPNTPALRHSNTPLLVHVHSSGIDDKVVAECINVTAAVLALIVQQDVFRCARRALAVVVEVRTFIGPVSIIEHESVHRDHHAVLGGAVCL